MNKKLLYTFFLTLGYMGLQAQDGPPANWFNLDKEKDGVYGVSTERAYEELLKGKSSVSVVVAVIDSGVDAEHEDLDDVMWVNPGETADNGIDDDGNGYVDDVHGWNFIGGPDGKNVNDDNLEIARVYKKYSYKYENADPEKLTKKGKKEYEFYQKVKKELEENRAKAEKSLERIKGNEGMIYGALDALEAALGGSELTPEFADSLATTGEQQFVVASNIVKQLYADAKTVDEMKNAIGDQYKGAYEYYGNQLEYGYNPDFDSRVVIGDNYEDQTEKYYGNNDVEGPDAFHGTHVAGIIGAERDNGLGMNGVADNVKIMSVRTVPNGDERDKDVANAIRYAVDNGASVVNMSFGKGYSWNEEVVEKAIKYAEKNDVLLVHAAGNSSQDNDVTDNFPNDMYRKRVLFWKKDKTFDNWLEVGALNWKEGEDAVAPFSNYGKENVDVFAPGMAIYSTTPDNNYQNAQGTSMASPVVAGVAALIRSYYPSLTAEQVKEIIEQSSDKRMIKVSKPGSDEVVDFSSLSTSGGHLNAFKALELASKTKGKKKIKANKA